MISLAACGSRRVLAQKAASLFSGACDHVSACQSPKHAGSISPLPVMVCRNHYPSPSSPRFGAFAFGSGGLFRRTNAYWSALCKKPFPTSWERCKLAGNTNTVRGSKKCSSKEYLQGRLPLLCWPDASGMIWNAPVSVQQLAQSSRQHQAVAFSQVLSSAQARVRFAMMSVCASVTDIFAAPRGVATSHIPAGTRSGGFFYANSRGGSAHRAIT